MLAKGATPIGRNMLLIVTHKNDFTADFVIDKLNKEGIDYQRFNTEDVLQNHAFRVAVNGSDFITDFLGMNISSVWFRRIQLPALDDLDTSTKNYMREELYAYFLNLWEVLEVKWLSRPNAIYRAENKFLQLKRAQNIGFKVPTTLITSNASQIRDFYNKHEKEVIIKPIFNNRFFDGRKNKLIFTNKLSTAHIEQIEDCTPLPSIYQEYIKKDYELRVTVVGSKVFSASVDSQSSFAGKVDWRKDRVMFKAHELPHDIQSKCLQLVQDLGLSFGAIDLVVDTKGDFVFLEINPNGQWAWLEMDANLPIADAIIEFLTQN